MLYKEEEAKTLQETPLEASSCNQGQPRRISWSDRIRNKVPNQAETGFNRWDGASSSRNGNVGLPRQRRPAWRRREDQRMDRWRRQSTPRRVQPPSSDSLQMVRSMKLTSRWHRVDLRQLTGRPRMLWDLREGVYR